MTEFGGAMDVAAFVGGALVGFALHFLLRGWARGDAEE